MKKKQRRKRRSVEGNAPPTKFKIGDRVKCPSGMGGTVVEVEIGNGFESVMVDFGGSWQEKFNAKLLELDVAPTPKFKVGDRVIYTTRGVTTVLPDGSERKNQQLATVAETPPSLRPSHSVIVLDAYPGREYTISNDDLTLADWPATAPAPSSSRIALRYHLVKLEKALVFQPVEIGNKKHRTFNVIIDYKTQVSFEKVIGEFGFILGKLMIHVESREAKIFPFETNEDRDCAFDLIEKALAAWAATCPPPSTLKGPSDGAKVLYWGGGR